MCYALCFVPPSYDVWRNDKILLCHRLELILAINIKSAIRIEANMKEYQHGSILY
jgi:hypothetical protein